MNTNYILIITLSPKYVLIRRLISLTVVLTKEKNPTFLTVQFGNLMDFLIFIYFILFFFFKMLVMTGADQSSTPPITSGVTAP